MKRPWLWFLIILISHFTASVGSFLWSYSLSSSHFEGHHVSQAMAIIVGGVFKITWFPFAYPISQAFPLPGVLGWLPIFLNSIICASAVVVILLWVVRLKTSYLNQS